MEVARLFFRASSFLLLKRLIALIISASVDVAVKVVGVPRAL